MIVEYNRVRIARKWMKKNEPFLQVWHAHLGFSLHLFTAFQKPQTPNDVAEQYNYRLDLLERWIEVGVALGHLKKKRGNKLQSDRKMVKYFSDASNQSIGMLLKEMVELHIPTMLTYRHIVQGEKAAILEEDFGDIVAQTSGLLESVMCPKIEKIVKKHKIKSLLDVGCGHGGYLHRLNQKFSDMRLVGVETDEEVQKQAVLKAKNTDITIIHADFLQYTDESTYELIMMNNLFYYFSYEDRLKLFKRAESLLPSGGIFLIVTPLIRSRHGQRFATGFNSFMSAHEQMYPVPTEKELISYGKQAGFKRDQSIPVIREGGWYVLVFKKK
ncbi:class I SAM-dependent methyltransferase [Alkalicoccobacillus porphyridii]|uniref:class I SAM-dependent methyltransferase n=1 Tax=Alkalicoccobacillus porphyridii TaxID=2597270 RepID=UPI0021B11007|nr:class I SAM-dependent methyltransferase [Alkalicoccobacillus porphyridii]